MIYDALILYDGTKLAAEGILMKSPENYENIEVFNRISFLAIPDFMKSPNPILTSVIYCFNIKNIICYNWAFIYQEKYYSITLISSSFLPVIFMRFLKSISSDKNE